VISLCFIVKGEGHQKQKEEEKVICVFDQIMAKRAVLIGCNYPGTKAELKGCINDVKKTYRCLVDRYGFSEDDITVLIDTDDSYTQPTGRTSAGLWPICCDPLSRGIFCLCTTAATALVSPPRPVKMMTLDMMSALFPLI
jgi:hypothetical protein